MLAREPLGSNHVENQLVAEGFDSLLESNNSWPAGVDRDFPYVRQGLAVGFGKA